MRVLLELNETTLIDDGVNIFCDVYKKLDRSVCLGAAYEYIVRIFIRSTVFIFDFLGCGIGSGTNHSFERSRTVFISIRMSSTNRLP